MRQRVSILASNFFAVFLVVCFWQCFCESGSSSQSNANLELDPTVLYEQASRSLNTYCVSCHGPEKQKGNVRLDSLETIDAVDRQELLSKMQEVLQFGEMPPEEEKQPAETEKKVLQQWLNNQLTVKLRRHSLKNWNASSMETSFLTRICSPASTSKSLATRRIGDG